MEEKEFGRHRFDNIYLKFLRSRWKVFELFLFTFKFAKIKYNNRAQIEPIAARGKKRGRYIFKTVYQCNGCNVRESERCLLHYHSQSKITRLLSNNPLLYVHTSLAKIIKPTTLVRCSVSWFIENTLGFNNTDAVTFP